MTGRIKKIVADRGFGFITPDEGKGDLFFHVKGLAGCEFEELREGNAVTFDVEQGTKGPRAVRIALS